MSLGGYIGVVRRRWISILVIALVFVGLTAVYSFTTPKSYTATAQSFVALAGGDDNTPLTGAQFASQRVKSYTEIVGSPDVLQPVISELGLQYTDVQLAARVSATNPPATVLINVAATDGSPGQAAAIANAVSVQLGRTIESLETPNAGSVPPVKVTLTEPAQSPTSPSSPRIGINLLLGLALGLACGLGWAFMRHTLDNTIKSPVELDSLSASPALGAVLFDPNAKTQVLSALDATAVQSEGYRTIRANLQYVNVDDPVRAFVVTSAAPGDGKTAVACNLAIALAQAGLKVCLVEADLRRPRLAEYLQINAQVGLTDVLAGRARLEDALQTWGQGMLRVLPPGGIPPNPSELLGSHQMTQVVRTLKSDFDVVILDSPPLLAVADAAVLASQADGAVVVVRWGKSSKDAVKHAIAALGQVNAKVLGTVLNAVPQKRGGDGYGYGYGYGYGHGYGARPSDPNVVSPKSASYEDA